MLQAITQRLQSHFSRSESSTLARIVISHFTGWSISRIVAERNIVVDNATAEKIDNAINRLLTDEPIQYILGVGEFFGRQYHCDHRALIPRPETEELVEMIIADYHHKEGLNILDIGTGTGCIATTLALEIKDSKVDAIDYSPNALSLATENAATLKAAVNFVKSDVLKWTEESLKNSPLDKRYDIIVSNPPYIKECEATNMECNVLQYEPHSALFVPDNDPLIFYQHIALFAARHLTPQGALYFEINQRLGGETCQTIHNAGFCNVTLHHDINNNPRIIKATL